MHMKYRRDAAAYQSESRVKDGQKKPEERELAMGGDRLRGHDNEGMAAAEAVRMLFLVGGVSQTSDTAGRTRVWFG